MKKYLIPNVENDYKPHLFRKGGIALVLALAMAVFAMGIFQNTVFFKTDFLSSVLPGVLVDFANQDRAQNQLSSLTVNPVLQEIAQNKANDMATKGYFSHDSPSGKIWWSWFSDAGYQYAYAGENLAVNFSDSQAVNQAWMNSPEHRANLLNGKFTEIGIATAQGIYQGEPTIFVVEEFGRPLSPAAAIARSINDFISTPTAKASTYQLPTKIPSVKTTKVLGESTIPPSKQTILVDTPTFVAIQNNEASSSDNLGTQNAFPMPISSTLAKLLTEPQKIYSIIYISLAIFVLIALLLMIFIEIRHQHPKNVIAGFFLIFFLLLLLYIFRTIVFGPVIVA
jgi:Cysteine-rich secretory protein family